MFSDALSDSMNNHFIYLPPSFSASISISSVRTYYLNGSQPWVQRAQPQRSVKFQLVKHFPNYSGLLMLLLVWDSPWLPSPLYQKETPPLPLLLHWSFLCAWWLVCMLLLVVFIVVVVVVIVSAASWLFKLKTERKKKQEEK